MPVPSQLRTNAAHSGLSVRYSNAEYIADRAFPARTDITKDEGTINVYDKSNLRATDSAGPLSPRAAAPEVDWAPATAVSYVLERRAFKELVLQDAIDNADEVYDPEEDAVLNLTDRLLVLREIGAATAAFTAANWTSTTTLSGTSQWSDDTSNPLDTIETGMSTTFARPNHIIMGEQVWNELRHHPDVVQRYQYTSGGGVSRAQFGSLFDIPEANILVGCAKKITSEQGVTDTSGFIWGKHMLLARIEPSPGARSMTAQATLQRRIPREVTEWASNDPEGTWKKVEDRYLHKVTAADLGYLIVDAVA